MFRVTYIDNSNDSLAHKGGFNSTKEASMWVKEQGDKIIALKLLVWDEDINCFSTLREF